MSGNWSATIEFDDDCLREHVDAVLVDPRSSYCSICPACVAAHKRGFWVTAGSGDAAKEDV